MIFSNCTAKHYNGNIFFECKRNAIVAKFLQQFQCTFDAFWLRIFAVHLRFNEILYVSENRVIGNCYWSTGTKQLISK